MRKRSACESSPRRTDSDSGTLAYTDSRPSQQRHRPDKLQGQTKDEVRQHLHRWKLGPMLVTARFVRTVEHERIKRRYLEMTKSEEINELKTRIRARASDRARPAQSIIERILAAPTTTRGMLAFERSH